MPAYDDVRLINTVLNLYYEEKLTQSDIAERLDLSTSTVNRLLQKARELGYVTFVIRTPFQHLFDHYNVHYRFHIQSLFLDQALNPVQHS